MVPKAFFGCSLSASVKFDELPNTNLKINMPAARQATTTKKLAKKLLDSLAYLHFLV